MGVLYTNLKIQVPTEHVISLQNGYRYLSVFLKHRRHTTGLRPEINNALLIIYDINQKLGNGSIYRN